MPAYHVERSITIEQPLQTVHDALRDFKQWRTWSPWLIMEPDATVAYSDRQGQIGATYGWSGILIGAGSMELMEVHDTRLKMELMFVEPFRTTAWVQFDLESDNNATKVTWSLDGAFPFFMFWMKKKMQAYIGSDYERGLLMLKEYMETGSVASYVYIEGEYSMPPQDYIGIPRTCSLQELGVLMQKDFEALQTFSKVHHLEVFDIPFSIYNYFDVVKKETSYIACLPVKKSDVKLESRWVQGRLEEAPALKTRHKGRYLHLGNAWMTAMSFTRLKKIKTLKRPLGYEYYINDPATTREEALITEIYLPLKK